MSYVCMCRMYISMVIKSRHRVVQTLVNHLTSTSTLTECLCLMRLIAFGIVMVGFGCSVSDVDAILACCSRYVTVWLLWWRCALFRKLTTCCKHSECCSDGRKTFCFCCLPAAAEGSRWGARSRGESTLCPSLMFKLLCSFWGGICPRVAHSIDNRVHHLWLVLLGTTKYLSGFW